MPSFLETEEEYNENGVLVMDGDPGEQDFYGEILIAHIAFPLWGPIGEQNLAVFQGKTTDGDYTLDSDPLLSTHVVSDLSGGHGVEFGNIVSDATRYHFGTLYPRHPKQIGPGFLVNIIDPTTDGWTGTFTSADIRFMGDLRMSGTFEGLITIDAELFNVEGTATLGTLTAEPTGKAAVFRGLDTQERLVIPMGASGYAHYTAAGVFANRAAGAGTYPAAVCVKVVGRSLFALDTAGMLWHTEDLSGTWTEYGDEAQLPNASTGRALVPFFDRNIGASALFVVTDTDIWQFDQAGPSLYPVDANWPPHPDHGNAATKHDGDLFVPVGMGVHRYTNGSFLAMGFDMRDGLPLQYHGAIVDLVSEYNGMFALVGKGNDWQALEWRDGETEYEFRPSLHVFTGTGWHMLWEGNPEGGDDAVSNSLFVSRENSHYRVYWGVKNAAGSSLRYIDMPRTWATTSQRMRVKGGFASTGFIELPRFNAGMEGSPKVASHWKVKAKGLTGGSRITLFNRIDGSDTYKLHGAVTKSGQFSLPFGNDASGVFCGELFDDIQTRIEVENPSNDGWKIEHMELAYMKLVDPTNAWQMKLDLRAPWRDRSPEELYISLLSIIRSGLFVPMTLNGVTKRVKISQISREVSSGQDTRSIAPISVLELPNDFG